MPSPKKPEPTPNMGTPLPPLPEPQIITKTIVNESGWHYFGKAIACIFYLAILVFLAVLVCDLIGAMIDDHKLIADWKANQMPDDKYLQKQIDSLAMRPVESFTYFGEDVASVIRRLGDRIENQDREISELQSKLEATRADAHNFDIRIWQLEHPPRLQYILSEWGKPSQEIYDRTNSIVTDPDKDPSEPEQPFLTNCVISSFNGIFVATNGVYYHQPQ